MKGAVLPLIRFRGFVDLTPIVAVTPYEFSGLVLGNGVSVDDVLDLGVFALKGAGPGFLGAPVVAVSNSNHS